MATAATFVAAIAAVFIAAVVDVLGFCSGTLWPSRGARWGIIRGIRTYPEGPRDFPQRL